MSKKVNKLVLKTIPNQGLSKMQRHFQKLFYELIFWAVIHKIFFLLYKKIKKLTFNCAGFTLWFNIGLRNFWNGCRHLLHLIFWCFCWKFRICKTMNSWFLWKISFCFSENSLFHLSQHSQLDTSWIRRVSLRMKLEMGVC